MGDDGSGPLTLPRVAELADVEYPRLHSWLKRGLLTASVQISSGTGKPNLFSPDDARKAKILGDLSRAGVDFPSLSEAAGVLNEEWPKLSCEGLLAVNGKTRVFESTQSISEIDEPAVVYPLALAWSVIGDP